MKLNKKNELREWQGSLPSDEQSVRETMPSDFLGSASLSHMPAPVPQSSGDGAYDASKFPASPTKRYLASKSNVIALIMT